MDAPLTDILVPLDGSPAGERALGPAIELIHHTGVPLRVLSVAPSQDHQARAAYLAGVADRHAAVADIGTEVVHGNNVPRAIAEDLGRGTLVCMSSHGRGGLARAVLGSVAEALLRQLYRPVLVVGPHVRDGFTVAGRIVACVDGSRESERTLEPARQWADALDVPLWLIEVAEPAASGQWAGHGDTFEASHVAGVAQRLGGVEGWDVLHDKHAAHALSDVAASPTEPTALLVMATHGRTGWDRLRLGSVTTATVHRTLRGPELAIQEPARELAAAVLDGWLRGLPRPPACVVKLLTAGLLPEPVREGFGLPWGRREQQQYAALRRVLHATVPCLPPTLRFWPHYHLALKRVAAAPSTVGAGQ